MSSSIHSALLIALGQGLAACSQPSSVPPQPLPRLGFATAPGPVDPAPAVPAVQRGASAAPCVTRQRGLAWLSCDGQRIEVAHPVAFHPGRSIPPEPAKASLDAVAALLRAQRQILLVRIEAYGSHAAAKSAEAQRREIDASQSRADAVLEYLWRRRGISAERLEAVGYGSHPRFVGRAPRWHIVLRVMQRSEKVPSASPVR